MRGILYSTHLKVAFDAARIIRRSDRTLGWWQKVDAGSVVEGFVKNRSNRWDELRAIVRRRRLMV
jgi:hypothetical protein